MKKLLLLVPIIVFLIVFITRYATDNEIIYSTTLDEPTSISFWYVADQELDTFITDKTATFNKENEMINVETRSFTTIEEYQDALSEVTEKPNIVMVYNYWLNDLYNDGYLLDLSPYFDNLLIDLDETTYLKPFLDEVTFDDEIVALPFFKYSDIIYINNDLYQPNTQPQNIEIENPNNVLVNIIASCGFINWVDVKGDVAFNDVCVANNLITLQNTYQDKRINLEGDVDEFSSGNASAYIGSTQDYNAINESLSNVSIYPLSEVVTTTYGANIAIVNSEDYNDNLASLTYMLFLTNVNNQIQLFKQFGTIPTRSSVYENKKFTSLDNDLARLFSEEQEYFANAIPNLNGSYYIYQTMFKSFLDEIFLNNANVTISLDLFADQVQDTLNDYN